MSSQLLGSRLRTGLAGIRPEVISGWEPWGGEKFVAIWVSEDPREPAEHWLVRLDERTVSFRWKDYAHGNRPRTMTLDAGEFLRRFLLHAVPGGFMRMLARPLRQPTRHPSSMDGPFSQRQVACTAIQLRLRQVR